MKITFQTIPKGKKTPNGFWYDICQIVFKTKLKDFHRKTYREAGVHKTHTPNFITYFSVVMKETLCIVHTIAALHDLEVKAADLLNPYVMSPNREKIWTVLAPEFGDDAEASAIIVRALHILKILGSSFRTCLAQCM